MTSDSDEFRIHYFGDPVLRERAAEVEEVNDEIRHIIDEMWKVFDAHPAVGLAANQVGVLKRIFLVRHDEYLENGKVIKGKPRVYINPKITNYSDETWFFNEPCLSVPGVRVPVERPMNITIEALDRDGKKFVEDLEEYDARVRLHENDHLNGVLMVDRTSKMARKLVDRRLREIKKKHPVKG